MKEKQIIKNLKQDDSLSVTISQGDKVFDITVTSQGIAVTLFKSAEGRAEINYEPDSAVRLLLLKEKELHQKLYHVYLGEVKE